MGFLYNLGSGVHNTLFIKQQLVVAHAYIDRNQLKVGKVEDDLEKQMIQLENAAGTTIFQKAIKEARIAQRFVFAVVILIAVIFGVIYLINKLYPEIKLMENTLNWFFENVVMGTVILLIPFLLLIIGAQISRFRFNRLYGRKYEEAWRAIENRLGDI
jgi:uncharacterized integral membrane protein